MLAIFPLQRLIMVRERASGAYRTSSFFLAKMMTEVPSQILQRALFYLILVRRVAVPSFASGADVRSQYWMSVWPLLLTF